jgi:uncharacterized protein (TIGR02145 family)
MKKESIILIYPLIIMGMFLICINSCKKDDKKEPKSGILFNPDLTYGTITDNDGNKYKTITIETQTWLAENLRTTKYNDGTAIPMITDYKEWGASATPGMITTNNTKNADTIRTYGRLYNWYAVNTGMLCPTGWHVPADDEWTTLITYLGGEKVAGGHLKELGTTHWAAPNKGADNSSGFTAIPGSYRNNDGFFGIIGVGGNWWSSTGSSTFSAWYRGVYSDSSYVNKYSYFKTFGFSVRCLKDK